MQSPMLRSFHHQTRRSSLASVVALIVLAMLIVTLVPAPAAARRPHCHLRNMVLVKGSFCVDKYEAVTQIKRRGGWAYHSPFQSVGDKDVRAVSRSGQFPQAHISRNEAEAACQRSKKRLCTKEEWRTACKGKQPTRYPYGNTHEPGLCNDSGVSPLNRYYGTKAGPPLSAYGWGPMNDSKLNQLSGTLARTGSFSRCRNSYQLHDMVGNLHEWVADPGGTFLGGYYLDVKINGEGCDYQTVAHDSNYHDYSTGFRCCANPR